MMTSEVLNDNAAAAASVLDNDAVVAPAPAAPISIPSSLSVHGESVTCRGDCPIGRDEEEEDEEEEEETRPAMIGCSSSLVANAALERFFPAVRSLRPSPPPSSSSTRLIVVEEEEEGGGAPDAARAVPTLAVVPVPVVVAAAAAAADVRGAALPLLLAAAVVTCPDPSMSAVEDDDVLDILLASFDAISCACLGKECFLQKILNSPPHPFPWSSTTWKPARMAQDTCMV